MAWKTVEREPMEDDGIEMWKPELVGDFRKGEYIDREDDVGLKNDSTIYQFHDKDTGRDWKTWGSAMIDSLMKDIQIGTIIRLEYMGKKQSAKGNMYKVFQLAVWEDEEESPSSSSSSPESESELVGEFSLSPVEYVNTIVNRFLEADEPITKNSLFNQARDELLLVDPEFLSDVAKEIDRRDYS